MVQACKIIEAALLALGVVHLPAAGAAGGTCCLIACRQAVTDRRLQTRSSSSLPGELPCYVCHHVCQVLQQPRLLHLLQDVGTQLCAGLHDTLVRCLGQEGSQGRGGGINSCYLGCFRWASLHRVLSLRGTWEGPGIVGTVLIRSVKPSTTPALNNNS